MDDYNIKVWLQRLVFFNVSEKKNWLCSPSTLQQIEYGVLRDIPSEIGCPVNWSVKMMAVTYWPKSYHDKMPPDLSQLILGQRSS